MLANVEFRKKWDFGVSSWKRPAGGLAGTEMSGVTLTFLGTPGAAGELLIYPCSQSISRVMPGGKADAAIS